MSSQLWMPVVVPGTAVAHVVPVEDFHHEVDVHGSCLCGPEVRWQTSKTGQRVWLYRHAPLSAAFYTTNTQEVL